MTHYLFKKHLLFFYVLRTDNLQELVLFFTIWVPGLNLGGQAWPVANPNTLRLDWIFRIALLDRLVHKKTW